MRLDSGGAGRFVAMWMLLVLGTADWAWADRIKYVDRNSQTVEINARIVASEKGQHVLELSDGEYRVIPQGAVEERIADDGPEPLDGNAMAAKLRDQFGAERFRSYVQAPYVMGLVLSAPLPKNGEGRATTFLKQGAQFMKSVENAFGQFVKEARIDVDPPRFPLVVLIFEARDDFESYAARTTGGNGLSAARIAGFYAGNTNWLAIRLDECQSFDVPLHEAIHQQVYNRNVFQRLAPIPHWFDEGLATGFESANRKITTVPTKVSARYARQALATDQFDWKTMAQNDRVFMGDVLAGEAYGQAWGLHWLLVTRYRVEYGKYLRLLSKKKALEADDGDQRLADFKQAFGKDIDAMEKEFSQALNAAIKRQKLQVPEKPVGISLSHENLGHVEMQAVSVSGQLRAEGTLNNLSPFRTMSFHVTIETDAGTYAEWLIDELGIGKSASLATQVVDKRMANGNGGSSRTFRVHIRSTPADSRDAATWRKGQLPVPVYTTQN
ncbi:MAG TPA: DUF1570 domain-containing protein [Planctomycetaceae bacterium]|nr:DUF1570 domain-containing protein [Planctomycetaceae bacterium]